MYIGVCVSNTYLIELSHKTQLFHMHREHMCGCTYISQYVYYVPDLVYISTVTVVRLVITVYTKLHSYICRTRALLEARNTQSHIEAGATSPTTGKFSNMQCALSHHYHTLGIWHCAQVLLRFSHRLDRCRDHRWGFAEWLGSQTPYVPVDFSACEFRLHIYIKPKFKGKFIEENCI